jgi:CMP-N-acetylneuraminic acid synthetase
MSVIAIIPARGGSKRLPRKNVYPVLGIPMIVWTIRACQNSARISAVYVSTEDLEIAGVAREWGAEVIERPAALAGDDIPKQEAIVHAVEWLLAQGRAVDLVISVQPNSPELTGRDLDAGVEKLLAHGLWELFSVDARLIQNGTFRVMRRETVFWRSLSAHCGVIVADCLDVHTREDVEAVESRLKARIGRAGTPAPSR